MLYIYVCNGWFRLVDPPLSLNKNEWDGFVVKWNTNGMHIRDDCFACVNIYYA